MTTLNGTTLTEHFNHAAVTILVDEVSNLPSRDKHALTLLLGKKPDPSCSQRDVYYEQVKCGGIPVGAFIPRPHLPDGSIPNANTKKARESMCLSKLADPLRTLLWSLEGSCSDKQVGMLSLVSPLEGALLASFERHSLPDGMHPQLVQLVRDREQVLFFVMDDFPGCSEEQVEYMLQSCLFGHPPPIHCTFMEELCKQVSDSIGLLRLKPELKHIEKHIQDAKTKYATLDIPTAFRRCLVDTSCASAYEFAYAYLSQRGCQVRAVQDDDIIVDQEGSRPLSLPSMNDAMAVHAPELRHILFDDELRALQPEVEYYKYLQTAEELVKQREANAKQVVCIDDDAHGARLLEGALGHNLKMCDGTLYYRDRPGPWHEMNPRHEARLVHVVQELGYMRMGQKQKEVYGGNWAGAQSLVKSLKARLLHRTNDRDFEGLMLNSCHGRLCFTDGVYDCKQEGGRFLAWDECDFVHTTVTAGRAFPKGVRPDKLSEVKEVFLMNVFWESVPEEAGEEARQREEERAEAVVTHLLQTLARALMGHVEDKLWLMFLGLRSCGKGVLFEIIQNCFGAYVRAVESGALSQKDTTGDSAKALSWLVPVRFARLLVMNEVSTKSPLDGQSVKKLSSGGDEFQGRQNYGLEMNFRIGGTFVLACNEKPKVDPHDAYENCQAYLFSGKFETVDSLNREPNEQAKKRRKVGKGDIKGVYCKDPAVIDAFTMLVLQHYRPEKATHQHVELQEEMFEAVRNDNPDTGDAVLDVLFETDPSKVQSPALQLPFDQLEKSNTEFGHNWRQLEDAGITSTQMLKKKLRYKFPCVEEWRRSNKRTGLLHVRWRQMML